MTATVLLIAAGLTLVVPAVTAAGDHLVPDRGASTPDPAHYTIATNAHAAAYEGSVASGTMIFSITGKWNAVGVTCQPSLGVQQDLVAYIMIHGTLGGVASAALKIVCPAGGSTPSYSLFAGFPDGTVVALSVPVTPGDLISATIHLGRCITGGGGGLAVVMTDVTNEKSGFAGRCVSGFSPTFGGWVIGNGAGALTEFPSAMKFSAGTVVDSGVTLKISQLSSLTELVMVDSSNFVTAEPSTLSTTGTAFSITWVNST